MASMLCALKMEILLAITALCVCKKNGAALINFVDARVTDGFILHDGEFVTSLQALKEIGIKSWLFCFFRRINSSTILRGAELPLSNTVPPEKTDGTQRKNITIMIIRPFLPTRTSGILMHLSQTGTSIPPCTEEQAEWLIQCYRRHGYEIKKALSLDYRHWIISVRLPYSERPPRPSRTFQQRIWR